MLAVLYEDIAACTGVIIGTSGMFLSYYTGKMIYDSVSSILIGCLLGAVVYRMITLNRNYLLGQALDPLVENEITCIVRGRRSIDNVHNVSSQWLSPKAFSFHAEIDLDGTYLAANLYSLYKPFFSDAKYKEELPVFMAWYAEDVTRLVEREIKSIENEIKKYYPDCQSIDLELGSRYSNENALTEVKESREKENKALMNLILLLQKYGTLDNEIMRKKINQFKVPISPKPKNIQYYHKNKKDENKRTPKVEQMKQKLLPKTQIKQIENNNKNNNKNKNKENE